MAIGAVIVSNFAAAEEEPLWELGAGMGFFTIPDYIGSSEQRYYFFPLPYITYNGDKLTIDRRGAHTDIIETENMMLDISLNAGVPVKSDENAAREGMPDLLATIELGPSLEFTLSKDSIRRREWSLRLPLRAVIATDLNETETAGWVLNPHLNFNNKLLWGDWKFGVSAGPMLVTERNADYYYEVDAQYARAGRPAYDAKGGYGGTRFTLALRKRFDKVWVGGFARYDYLTGAVFEDSPLVEQRHALLVGAGISYIFAQSMTWVQVDNGF